MPGRPPRCSPNTTRLSGSLKGSGRRRTPSTREKIAVVAPMPRARVKTMATVNPGFLRKRRKVRRRSFARPVMEGPPEVRRGRLENIARECSTDEGEIYRLIGREPDRYCGHGAQQCCARTRSGATVKGGGEPPHSIFGDRKKTKYYTYQKW